MPHVVIAGAIHESGIELIEKRADFTYAYIPSNEDRSYVNLIKEADALVIRTQPLTAKDIKEAADLKIVSRHGVGYDSIDTFALEKKNILLTIVGDVNSQSVAEHAMTLMLAAFKRLIKNDEAVRVGPWNYRNTLEPQEIYKKSLLILGYGRIGRKIAKMAASFGMMVMAYDPFISKAQWPAGPAKKIDDFEFALKTADCISVNMPRSEKTILNKKEFEIMKNGVVIINTARGEIIDEKALIQALNYGKVGAAGLDVFEREPPEQKSPFSEFKQVILTPHVAGLSEQAAKAMAISSVQNVIDYFDGKLNQSLIVNRKRLLD